MTIKAEQAPEYDVRRRQSTDEPTENSRYTYDWDLDSVSQADKLRQLVAIICHGYLFCTILPTFITTTWNTLQTKITHTLNSLMKYDLWPPLSTARNTPDLTQTRRPNNYPSHLVLDKPKCTRDCDLHNVLRANTSTQTATTVCLRHQCYIKRPTLANPARKTLKSDTTRTINNLNTHAHCPSASSTQKSPDPRQRKNQNNYAPLHPAQYLATTALHWDTSLQPHPTQGHQTRRKEPAPKFKSSPNTRQPLRKVTVDDDNGPNISHPQRARTWENPVTTHAVRNYNPSKPHYQTPPMKLRPHPKTDTIQTTNHDSQPITRTTTRRERNLDPLLPTQRKNSAKTSRPTRSHQRGRSFQ